MIKIGQSQPVGEGIKNLLQHGKAISLALSLAAITSLTGCAAMGPGGNSPMAGMQQSSVMAAENVSFGKVTNIQTTVQRSSSPVGGIVSNSSQELGRILGKVAAGADSRNPLTRIIQNASVNLGSTAGRAVGDSATSTYVQTVTVKSDTGQTMKVTQPPQASSFRVGQRVAVGTVEGRQQVFDAGLMLQMRPDLQSQAALSSSAAKPHRSRTMRVASSMNYGN